MTQYCFVLDSKGNKLSQHSLEQLVVDVFADQKYNGKLSSFSAKNRTKIVKFYREFIEEICPYAVVKEKATTKKYKKIGVVVTKDQEFDVRRVKNKDCWVYNPNKKMKKQLKELIKFGNSHRCTKSIVDVFTRVFNHFKNKEVYGERPQAFENERYITFVTNK